MAIIYTYPQISTLSLSDSVLITDNVTSDPAKRTKQATVQQLKTLIAGSPLSLTTNNTSGAATLSSGNVLNVPNYSSGSGTAGTIPKWLDSNTLTDSPFTIDTSTNSLDIPSFIRHIGDTDSQFGFQTDNHFRVQTGGQTTIQSISRTDENSSTGQVAGLYFNSSQRFFTRTDGV